MKKKDDDEVEEGYNKMNSMKMDDKVKSDEDSEERR